MCIETPFFISKVILYLCVFFEKFCVKFSLETNHRSCVNHLLYSVCKNNSIESISHCVNFILIENVNTMFEILNHGLERFENDPI